MLFHNRMEAGQLLASKLSDYANQPNTLVLGLARRGVPVAYAVAQALNLPLDVFVVRKLGAVDLEEMAIGAITSGGTRVLNHDVVYGWNIDEAQLAAITAREQAELDRREKLYRRGMAPLNLRNKTVILIDDGVSTGLTMQAASIAVRQHHPKHLVVAVPAASPEMIDKFRDKADQVVCAVMPRQTYTARLWYRDFSHITDDEVRDLISRGNQAYR